MKEPYFVHEKVATFKELMNAFDVAKVNFISQELSSLSSTYMYLTIVVEDERKHYMNANSH